VACVLAESNSPTPVLFLMAPDFVEASAPVRAGCAARRLSLFVGGSGSVYCRALVFSTQERTILVIESNLEPSGRKILRSPCDWTSLLLSVKDTRNRESKARFIRHGPDIHR